MYVRIATFEGSPEELDGAIDMVKGDVQENRRPPGLEDAKGMLMLVDRKSGKSMGMRFCSSVCWSQQRDCFSAGSLMQSRVRSGFMTTPGAAAYQME